MKRKYVLVGILILALAGLLIYSRGGGHAPFSQAPLERLTFQNLGDIRNAFNAAKDNVRVLVLLSPT